MMPPTAALTTIVGFTSRNATAILRATGSTISGSSRIRNFWMKRLLWRPELRRKCPSKTAPRLLSTSSRGGVAFAASEGRIHASHFVEDRPRRPEGIRRFDDGTPDNDVNGTGRDGLRRRRHAFLVAVRRVGRTDARREREKVGSMRCFDFARFARAADDAGASGVFGKPCEFDGVLERVSAQPDGTQIVRAHAGEYRYGEDVRRRHAQFARALVRRVDGRAHHLGTAEGVNVDDMRAVAHELFDAGRDGARNVVQFRVDEVPHVA